MADYPLALMGRICEPIPIVFFVWGGPSLSLAFLTRSLLALVVVVFVKSILFASFARVGAARGFFSMVGANGVSSIAGFLLAIALGSGTELGFAALLILMAIGSAVAKTCCRGFQGTRWGFLTPGFFITATAVLAIVSLVVGFILTGVDPSESLAGYWLVKTIGATVGVAGSLTFTILWEGAVVSAMNRKADANILMKATVASNLWAFFIFFLIGAAIALPQRLKHPGGVLPG